MFLIRTAFFLTFFLLFSQVFGFLEPQPTCPNCPACQNVNGCLGTVETTTQESTESTTLEYYQQHWQNLGWKTDDDGNVFIGDDDNNLKLIQIGSWCPKELCKGWFGIW
ncbi:unnamed protein product [Caenorhabditis angaria]|uniref:Secreted protein n=1 Tax=Caenorhabditis angaria TaxID=860376 RepID=A0A9P1IC99_9PELO|nr:unnamed protein product [Caenorhabditis angaria]